jgi:hypothetical protein
VKNHNSSNKSQFDELRIRRRDIRSLLRANSAAILLDQAKVDALPRKYFHPEYSRGMWFRCRERHISFIDDLIATTGAMPKRLLGDLTVLAACRDPVVVRKTMVEMFGQRESLAPGEIDTATLFFQALLEFVGNQSFEPDSGRDCKHSRVRMTRWLKLIDPLRIAEDSECGYLVALQRAFETSDR